MADVDPNPLNAYRQSNVEGTLNLAKQAAHSGVKRFVFVSSVKVNGEGTLSEPFRPSDTPMPSDPYGHSKWEAECGLAEIGRATGMEIVVIRPPLVYGPGVKANFLNLMKLVRSGIPLPFGRASGRRSLVALDNLVDVLILCTHHPAAADRTFLVSDGNDLTIGELATEMAIAMRMKPRLLPVPVALITTLAKLVGRSSVASRLFGSLQVDISDTKQVLGWMPNITPRCAIEKTVLEFLRMEGKV
jgi:UDP-glucose 4-epimerase